MTDLAVAPCSYKAARYAVEHWHYSRTMPQPPLIKFGAWENGHYTGCVLYGRGASNTVYERFGIHRLQGAELVRVALREHTTPVSRIVALTLRALRHRSPGTRLVVSFADPHHGHHGGIYQAGNWLYTGVSTPGVEWLDPTTGKRYHDRSISPNGYRTHYGVRKRTPTPDQLTRVALPGKHRYVYPMDRAMRRRITPMALPYPRADQVSTGDTPPTSGEGQVRSLRSAPPTRTPPTAVTPGGA